MEILNETKMMLPLTQSCLKKAVSDLKSLIDTHESFFKENSIDLIPSHEFIEVAETICA
jgi:hypothetical protein